MASARGGFAVPVKILKRSSFKPHSQGSPLCDDAEQNWAEVWANGGEERNQRTKRGCKFSRSRRASRTAHICSAKVIRKQRSDRAGTRQQLGAPSLGSGKHQTPPNRYPPARLLKPLRGVKPA